MSSREVVWALPSAEQQVDGRDLPVVVVGGNEYSWATNSTSLRTAITLAQWRRVLWLHSEAHGSVLRRVQGRAAHLSAADVVRTVFGSTRPRRVEERLWLAPVRGVAAIAPLWAPEPMRKRNVRILARVIRGWLRDIGASECILLFYWWALPELVDAVPHAASIYDCIDDHSARPGSFVRPALLARLEGRLLDAVDQTYVVSPALLEDRERPGRRIAVLPTGLDMTLFRQLQRDGFTVPPELRAVSHPIIGYAGALGERMDWELLVALARRREDWNFVFLGGNARTAPDELRRPNVFFLPNMPYPHALASISHFDVATIPVRNTPFSRGNSFLKLSEYLAHGIPVVATPLPDTQRAAAVADGILHLANDIDSWETAIARSIEEPAASPHRAQRVRQAEEQSIERRASRIVNDALAASR